MTRHVKTRREFLGWTAGAAVGVAVGPFVHAHKGAAAEPLVVCAFGGAPQELQRRFFYSPFERATGIKIVDVSKPTLGQMKAQVESKNIEWDVVQAESRWVLRGTQEGLFEPIDTKIVDMTDLIPEAKHSHAVGTYFWSKVIAYNSKIFPKGKHPKSWKDFWDVKAFPGRRSLQNIPVRQLEFALLADGVPKEKLYPIDVERAYKKLDQIKPHIHAWYVAAQGEQLLMDGEVVMVPITNGRALVSAAKGFPIDIEFNEGGLELDSWVVLKGTKKREQAMQFINFASKPENQAKFSEQYFGGPTNKKTFGLLSDEVNRKLPSHPSVLSKQFLTNTKWWADNETAMTERWNKWLIT